MTVNAVVTACNQKNNRDPMMELDDTAVEGTLDELRKHGLVSVVLPAPGARTNRYRHEVAARFGWEKRVMAIMTELLLRGPQTAGELRGRCSRLMSFEGVDAVVTALDYMQTADPPLVKPLPRQAGQSAVRYAHLFYLPEEMAGIDAAAASAASASGAGDTAAGGVNRPTTRAEPASMGGPPAVDAMRAEIADLKEQVARLSAELTDLRQRFEALENQLK
jgi:hypothetical protein